VRRLDAPATGNRITYDAELKGFGVRMTAAGAKAFILNYRTAGRERRITIGSFPDWSVPAAREQAKNLKRRIDQGQDPMGDRHEERTAPTIADLAQRFEAEHLTRRRSTTAKDYSSILRGHTLPALGKTKVADLRHADVEKLHRKIAATAPYRATRAVSVLSKMISLAVKWEMRDDNPVKGIERAPEQKRERFLTLAEMACLGEVLLAHPEKTSCRAIRLLLLTGARRGETLAATWAQFDLERGIWTKPSTATQQAKEHRIPLSGPALAVLAELRADAEADCPYVFPGSRSVDAKGNVTWAPLTEIKRTWASVCKSAGIEGVRVHDLRHSYASILASSGLSLPIIGALLGHTQAATTAACVRFGGQDGAAVVSTPSTEMPHEPASPSHDRGHDGSQPLTLHPAQLPVRREPFRSPRPHISG